MTNTKRENKLQSDDPLQIVNIIGEEIDAS